MSLWKRGGIWWSYIYRDGVRTGRSTGTGNRREAERIEQKFKDELNALSHQLPKLDPKMPFAVLAGKFLAEGTPKPYHRDRLKHLLPFFGAIQIGSFTKNTAASYRLYRHRQKELTEATINRDLGCLRNILFWAVDEGLLSKNPLSRMRMERERRKKRPVLSLEEEALLLPAAPSHVAPIILAALDSGLRRGELLSQDWPDIDFARELLIVTHSKTPEGECREVPMTKRLFALLWEMRQDDGPLFTYKGKRLKDLKTAWKGSIRRAGIRYLPFHYLRHTFNTRLMEAGVIREVRMALMGHSSGEDVHTTYTHVELPMKREAIRKLEEWTHQQKLNQENVRE